MKPRFVIILIILTFNLLHTIKLFAQEDKYPRMVTDRPSQNDASLVVPQGTIQMENGYIVQRKTHEDTNSMEWEYRYPNAALRIGVFKVAELRLKAALKHFRTELINSTPNNTEEKFRTKTGIGNVAVGTKIQICHDKGIRPEAAFQAEVQFPWGSKQYNPDLPETRLRLCCTNDLTKKITLQYNLGFEWENTESDTSRKFDHNPQYAVALGYDFTEKFRAYVEFYGQKTEGNPFEQSMDSGIAYLVLPNFQLDASAGLGLNKAAPDFTIDTGICFRLPH